MVEPRTISHDELVDDLSAFLMRAEAGAHFVITMDGRPMAKLRPFDPPPDGGGHDRISGGSPSNRPGE
jgi:antitoxin (DNA-binding transcriptional repressor) of toxin-antitoxin stability system